MPNFANVGYSLGRELDMDMYGSDSEEEDPLSPRTPRTPEFDLGVIEEDSDEEREEYEPELSESESECWKQGGFVIDRVLFIE